MFCTSSEKPDWGLGKLIRQDGNFCEIEYFVSPVSDPEIVRVKKSSIKIKSLPDQTRVYWSDAESELWRIGRVIQGEGDSISVQFPNKDIKNIQIEQLFTRWSLPINDPTPYLASFVNETPLFAESRRKYIKSIMKQRALSAGMSGLLSSSIELEPHQYNVIKKILNDPIQRYLLADEVGLGKTIEAGILIRQYILDDPEGHYVVVIVPPTLVNQWRGELITRFHLENFLDDTVHVIASDDIDEVKDEILNAKMLVIDEAHHIVRGVEYKQETHFYKLISEACHRVDRLLLLSATPVISNTKGFLAMLHLLDPTIYSLSGLDAFMKKIEMHKELAYLIADLVPENVLMLQSTLEALKTLFPNDSILLERVEELGKILEISFDEEDPNIIESVVNLRAHISETYKLHRRILRHRRSKVQGITPNRIGIEVVSYQQQGMKFLIESLEKWRSDAASHVYGLEDMYTVDTLSEIYSLFMDALLSDTLLLVDLAEARLSGKKTNRSGDELSSVIFDQPLLTGESTVLKEIINFANQVHNDKSRFELAVQKVSDLQGSGKKVVIFCSTAFTADHLYEICKAKLIGVCRHILNADTALSNNDHSILICDHSAEEGLNLQGGDKVIFHFDLPLSPNRLEQRTGRLDRYGARYDILSYIIQCDDNPYEREWINCVSEGFGLFSRSIASLQFLIEEKMSQLKNELLIKGIEALPEFKDQLSGDQGIIAKELKDIELYDELDALLVEYDDSFDDLVDYDSDWMSHAALTDEWVCKSLLFKAVPHHISQPFPPDRVFRYQYSHDQRNNTLISLTDYQNNFIDSIDVDAPNRSWTTPMTPAYSFRRQTAVSKKLRILRYGDTFLRGISDFTEVDDRGRSHAIWRTTPDYIPENVADLFLRFDFVIETNIAEVLQLVSSLGVDSKANFKRIGDMLFPAIVRTIWLDSELRLVDDDRVGKYLDIGYNRSITNGILDKNIKYGHWMQLIESDLPYFSDWRERCFNGREAALQYLSESTDLEKITQEYVNKAKALHQQHYTQLRSRIIHLHGDEADCERKRMKAEEKLHHAYYEGILNPTIRLDAVGAIFLYQKRL